MFTKKNQIVKKKIIYFYKQIVKSINIDTI
jgi:hypothetical protein